MTPPPPPEDRFEYTRYNVWVRHLGGTNLHLERGGITYAEAYKHWQKHHTKFGDFYILGVFLDPEEHHKQCKKARA